MYLRASRWYQQNGLLAEAIESALAAGDSQRVVDLLERFGMQFLERTSRPLPITWVDALDAQRIASRPMLAIVLAFSEIIRQAPHQIGLVDSLIAGVEQALSQQPNLLDEEGRPLRDTILGYVAALRSALGRLRGMDPAEIIHLAREALQLLPEQTGLARFNACRALYSALFIQGETRAAEPYIEEAVRIARASQDEYHLISSIFSQAHLAAYRGHLRAAAQICEESIQTIVMPVEKRGWGYIGAGTLFVWLGRIALEWNDLAGAEQRCMQGLDRLQYLPEIYLKMRTWGWLARIHWIQGRTAEAEICLDQCARSWPGAERYAAAQRVRLWLMRSGPDDLQRAEAWAQPLLPDAENTQVMRSMMLTGEWHNVEQMTLARVLIARRRTTGSGDLRALMDALEVQQRVAEACDLGERVIEIMLLRALALDAMGQTSHAMKTLAAALTLALPQGYQRIFIDEGQPFKRLLLLLGEQPGMAALQQMVAALLLALTPETEPGSERQGLLPPQTQPVQLAEPLTERELEVLRLIATGLTTGEIAKKLYLSPNTLKAHTLNIYGKLDAHSRVQAVNKARELGLI